MTYQTNCTLPEELLEQIAEQGLNAMPDMIRTIINTALQLERQAHLGAGPCERTLERRGYANGFKPKTVATRMGQITFAATGWLFRLFYPGQPGDRIIGRAIASVAGTAVGTLQISIPGCPL